MKKIVRLICVAMAVMLFANGCCSYAVYKGSKNRVAQRKALAMGDEPAIKATRLGSDGVGIGIDVTNIEALSERPFLQFGAALLDAAIIYGGYEGVKALQDENDDDDDKGRVDVNITNDNSSDNNENNVLVIVGDQNTASSNQDKEVAE